MTKLPSGLLVPHHSAADWDFQNANWEIDTSLYVSAPSSLHGTGLCIVLAKNSFPTNIPDGRITTYYRSFHDSRSLYLYFRNQAAVGTATFLNTYAIERRLNGHELGCMLEYWVAGVHNLVGSFGTLDALSADTWYHFRLSFWQSWGHLLIKLERYIAGSWVQEGVTIEHAANLWADSAINRAGLYLNASDSYDDTEICWP